MWAELPADIDRDAAQPPTQSRRLSAQSEAAPRVWWQTASGRGGWRTSVGSTPLPTHF
jgi:hypothetical protein